MTCSNRCSKGCCYEGCEDKQLASTWATWEIWVVLGFCWELILVVICTWWVLSKGRYGCCNDKNWVNFWRNWQKLLFSFWIEWNRRGGKSLFSQHSRRSWWGFFVFFFPSFSPFFVLPQGYMCQSGAINHFYSCHKASWKRSCAKLWLD